MRSTMLLVLTFFALLNVGQAARGPAYADTNDVIGQEIEKRNKESVDTIKLTNEALLFPGGATTADIEENFETGGVRTARSAGGEVEAAGQALFRRKMSQWHKEKFTELGEFNDNLREEVHLATRDSNGNCDDGGDDLVCKQLEKDKMLHGPKAIDPAAAFAKADSTTLNSAPHARSQQGASCQSAKGNSANISMAPQAATFSNACQGESLSERKDCKTQSLMRNDSESKGAAAATTKLMSPVMVAKPSQLGNINTAVNSPIKTASCPTSPSEALAAGQLEDPLSPFKGARMKLEREVRTGERTRTAQVPPRVAVKPETKPWYIQLIAWVLPVSTAAVGGDFRQDFANSIEENYIAELDFQKLIGDIESNADIAGAQDFYHMAAKGLENENKTLRTLHQQTKQSADSWRGMAELDHKPF